MARKISDNISNNGAFKHGTSIGENGEILYDAPIEIKDQADMSNYGITDSDCRYLNFNGSQKMRVYFFKTENRQFAEAQWAYIDTLHSSGYASARCPYGRTPETREAPVISWDGMVDSGYEPEAECSVERQVMARIEYQEIRARMDAEDPRIAIAFEAKELYGDSVKEIAHDLGVSEPRIYQLVARAKEIGKNYKEEK